MAIHYRPSLPHDIDELISVNTACLPENYDFQTWQILLDSSVNLGNQVAVSQGHIVGYVLLTHQEEGMNILSGLDPRFCTITSLAVLPRYRGKGIATQLIKRAVAQARRFQPTMPIDIHVRVSNSAINLYSKLGFYIVEKIKRYYRDPIEDAFHMVLNVGEQP